MLNNSYECRGISSDVARKDASDIFSALRKEIPKAVISESEPFKKEVDTLEVITAMELTLYGAYDDTKLIIIREFASGEYFIVLNIKTKKE